jgi:hypothetical protein
LKSKLDRHDDMSKFDGGDGLFKNWGEYDSDNEVDLKNKSKDLADIVDIDKRLENEYNEMQKTDSDSCSAVSSNSESESSDTSN